MAVILTPIGENTDKKYTDVERELIYTVRTLLKDLPDDVYRSLSTLVEDQRGERWSDAQIYTYLCQSLAKINSAPPLTTATLDSYPTPWTACITTGAVCYALIGESISQIGEHFSYSDNGISLSIDLASKYQGMAQMLLSGYEDLIKDIKRAMRPYAASIKSAPAPVRVRSFSPRMWCFR